MHRQHLIGPFIVASLLASLSLTSCQISAEIDTGSQAPAGILGRADRLQASSGQMIRLLAGTQFNPGPEVSVPVGGNGFIVFDFADENAAGEIPFVVSESEFLGTNPLGDYVLRSNDLAGLITDVVTSDRSGSRASFVSGSLVVTGFFRREITSGPGAGLVLFTHEPAIFSGPVTGLPFPAGTTFRSAEPLDVFVTVDGEDILAAVSTDRTVTIIASS